MNPRVRLPRVRRGTAAAIWTAAVALGIAVQPVLLPHPGWVQVVAGGAAGLQGYLLGVLVAKVVKIAKAGGHLTRGRRRRAGGYEGDATARSRPGYPGGLVVLPLLALLPLVWLPAHAAQVRLSERTGMTAQSAAADLLAVLGAAAATAALVLLARLVRRCVVPRWRTGTRARRIAVLALTPSLVLFGAPADAAGVRPHSGGDFLRGVPDAAAISAVTHRPARTPVRVYVARERATDPAGRARVAIAELERAGAFERSTLLVGVPTGSGWINPAAVRALEEQVDGDVATVAVQYAALPSWLAYLRGGDGVRSSVRALLVALQDRLAAMPVTTRSRLLVYGESLGAWGGLRALTSAGASGRADRALWVGLPGGLPASMTNRTTRTLAVAHDDDPVPAWSPRLMLRGSGCWPATWLPVTSFWQATGDVLASLRVGEGYGHRYGSRELSAAWRDLLAGRASPSTPC